VHVTLQVTVVPELLQSIGRQLGKFPEELEEIDVEVYLTKQLHAHCRDILTREVAANMTNDEIKRRVYHLIREITYRGPVPIHGKTDRELIDALPGLTATKVRWARYWLKQNGYLKETGKRRTGKIWGATDVEVPNELKELPDGLLAIPEETEVIIDAE